MKYDKITSRQLGVLHILWEERSARSVKELADRSKTSFINSILIEFIIDKMLSKGIIMRTGEYGTSSDEKNCTMYLYSPNISFGEYYFERFRKISPQNLYCLVEKILCSGKLSASMLQCLEKTITDRLKDGTTNS